MSRSSHQHTSRARALQHRPVRGLSLIELMVALVIASVITLAIFGVMSTFEGRKRTTTSLNDASQAGNYATYYLDRLVRSAGSGMWHAGPVSRDGERTAVAFGCRVLAASGGTSVLPAGSALPVPFERINPTGTAGTFRLAPALIIPGESSGQGFGGERSDVLLVMGGNGGFSEVPTKLTGPISAGLMPLENTVAYTAGDILLLAGAPVSGVQDCMMQQVQTVGATLGLGGTYAADTIDSVSRAVYDNTSLALKIGNVNNNAPTFTAIGVGANATLMGYDLLRMRTPALQSLAESVFEMHAVYGVDSNGDGVVDRYFSPGSSGGNYTVSSLMAGTAAAADFIANIKTVRIALVIRSSLQEKVLEGTDPAFMPDTINLFEAALDADGVARVTRPRDLSLEERRFRYRVIETTIPIRNTLMPRS